MQKQKCLKYRDWTKNGTGARDQQLGIFYMGITAKTKMKCFSCESLQFQK